jgi:ribosomal protein S18 acetylase RimI-like enzyme
VPPADDSPRRIPFVVQDAEDVIAFARAHGSPYDTALLRRLLLDLTSDPAGVFVVRDAAGISLAAAVVDRVTNGADAASLEMLGVRAPLTAAHFARLIVEPAVAFARAGDRRALHVPLQESLMPAEDAAGVLREAGFAHAYDTYPMRRDRSAPDQPIEPLPDGWTWAALDGPRVDAAHAALLEMFHGSPSFGLGPLDGFRQAVASGATVWRALLDGQRIAGLLHVAFHDQPEGRRLGEVRTIGRAPAYRGRGVGPRLVRESLRLLAQGGVGDAELVVEAKNVSALALYRRFGFEPTSQTPVFAIDLR